MGWVFEKIVEIVMQAISFLMAWLAMQLIDVFKLDGRNTLNYFFDVFNGVANSGYADYHGAGKAGVFYGLYQMCMYAGLGIIFLGMLYNLYKAYFGNLAHADPPGKTVFRSIVFALLCGFAQSIVALVFDIAQIPYDAIINDLNPTTIAESVAKNFTALIANGIADPAGWAGAALAFGAGLGAGSAVFDVNFYVAIMAIILFLMLLKNFMVLALEMAERYLMIGILAVFSPICIACGAVRATQDVFANWLAFLINGCVVLTINTFFLAIFICNFVAYANIPYLLMWIAWIKTGQKIDEHMNSLGLKTAKTGGFGMDVMNAMRSSLPMALGAADKFAGTRLAGLHSAAMSGGQRSAGKGWGVWNHDPRLGEKGPMSANNALAKKVQSGGQKAAATVSKAANKPHEMMQTSSGHGKRTGISHEDLEKMAQNGQLPKPGQPGFENAAKDLMDAKLGKDANGNSLSEQLDKQGYKLTSMTEDANGKLNFSAEDNKGNVLVGEATPGEAKENSGNIDMKGENGEHMGLSLAQEQKEGQENPLKIGDMADEVPNNADTAALPGADMEENGTVQSNNQDEAQGPPETVDGQQVGDFDHVEADSEGKDKAKETADVDGKTYTLDGQPDENGIVTGTDDQGNKMQFQKDEDGNLQAIGEPAASTDSTPAEFTDKDGKTWKDTGEKDANGNAIFSDGQGNSVAVGEDGSMSEPALPTSQNADGKSQFTDANGTTWTDTGNKDADGNAIFSDGNGNEKAMSVGENGAVSTPAIQTSQNADGKSQFTDSNGNTWTDTGNKDANGNAIFSDGKGNEKAMSVGENGAVSAAMPSMNQDGMKPETATSASTADGKQYSLEKNNDGTYTGTAKDGSKATFQQDASGNMVKTSETSALGSKDSVNTDNMTANIGGKEYNLSQNGKGFTATATDGSGTKQLSQNDKGGWNATTQVGNVASGTQVTDANGRSFNLGNTSKVENGSTITGTAKDGSSATFKKNDDGTFTKTSESRSFDTNKGIGIESTAIPSNSIKKDANGAISSISVGGREYSNFQDLGNGQMVGHSNGGVTARFSNDNGNVSMQTAFAHDKDGNKFKVSDSSLSVGATRQSNGDVKVTKADGTSSTISAKDAAAQNIQTTFQNNNGQNVTMGSGGFNTSYNSKTGQIDVTANGTVEGSSKASTQSVQNASLNVGGYKFDSNTKFESSTNDKGQTTYTARDSSGAERTLTQKEMNSATATAGTTTFGTTTGTTVAVSGGQNEKLHSQVGLNNYNQNANPSDSGVIVKGSGKDGSDESYFRTVGTQRYDKNGVPSANGDYMRTMGQDGQEHFKQVHTNANGTIPTYQMNSQSAAINFQDNGSYHSVKDLQSSPNSDFAKNVDTVYGLPSSGQPATMLRTSGNEMYKIPESDRREGTPQQYVNMGTAEKPQYQALDMDRCKFNDQGQLERGSDVYLQGQDKPITNDSSAPFLHQSGKDDPALYYQGVNTRTNDSQFINIGRNQATPCVELGSFHNGNNINMDFSNVNIQRISNDGQPDGRQLVTWPNGQSAVLHPNTTNTSGMTGSYVQIGGQEYFMAPNPNNIINSVASGIAATTGATNWNFNEDIPRQKIEDMNAIKTLRQNFGIPETATNIEMQHRKGDVGTIITYSNTENGQKKTYAITGCELKNATNAEQIKGPNGTIMGIRQEYKSDKVHVPKPIRNFSNGMNYFFNSPGSRNKRNRR